MEIHELNTFSGTLGSNDYFATDNGSDTSKVSAEAMMAPLNERIDNIIAGPAPSAQEVTDARLGVDGYVYSSLGDAIRGQAADLHDDFNKIINTQNLLFLGKYIKGAYYSAGHYDSASYDYFIVNISSGNSYYFPRGLRFLSKENQQIYSHSNWQQPYTYTADYTGKLYVTFSVNATDYYMLDASADMSSIGSFQKPSLNGNIMLQELGYSKKYAVSQDAITKSLHPAQTLADERNLLQKCAIHEGAYYYSGQENASSSYDYYIVPVTSNETYMISAGCRFLAKKSSNIANNANYMPVKYTADYTGDLYVSFSNNGYGCFVTKASDYSTMVGSYQQNKLKDVVKHYSKGYASVSASSMNDGDTLYLPFTNLKKNNRYYFTARVSSFSEISIGHGQGVYGSSWLRITASQIIASYYFTEVVSEYINHGLSISNDIAVEIVVNNDNTAKVTLWSNGSHFTATASRWFGEGNSDYFVSTPTATLTNCSFTWTSGDFVKKIWLFGDSYTSISDPARWCYYLHNNDDIDNILISGYGGENSNSGIVALNSAINNYGCPDTIIWAYGMNDGTDTSSAPAAGWENGILELMKICTSKGITPILCTIPTVPSINHEQKNSWIKSSGYRYIDFAKAVGASSSGAWYSGMLYSDNVHPTELGAKALYMQALIDCPEITFKY